MVNFNLKDNNMDEIAKLSHLDSIETTNEYRIYGLMQEGNPPILFSAQESVINAVQEKTMISFLTNNGVDAAMEDCSTADKKVYIGLRRDLRDYPELCSNFVQSFVGFLESRLDLPVDFKIHNIPQFKTNIKG